MTPQDDGTANAAPMCSELRCKGMYITKDPPAENPMIISGDTAHWWCERTQYSVGPDRDWVHRSVCTPSRSCYRRPGNAT